LVLAIIVHLEFMLLLLSLSAGANQGPFKLFWCELIRGHMHHRIVQPLGIQRDRSNVTSTRVWKTAILYAVNVLGVNFDWLEVELTLPSTDCPDQLKATGK
jgi:hypothetical protein